MGYGISIRIEAPFAEGAARVRDALKAQGFGVLTEIDVRATLRDKLGEDMEDNLALGACNPSLAHRALGIDLGARGLLRPKITTFTLDEAAGAYRRLLAGGLTGRAVIVPAAH